MHPISVPQTRSNQMGASCPSELSDVPKGIRMIPLVFPKFKPVLWSTSSSWYIKEPSEAFWYYQVTAEQGLQTRPSTRPFPKLPYNYTIWEHQPQTKSHLEAPQVICSACENHKHHLSQATGSWWQILSSGVQKAKLCLRLSAVFTLLPVI